MTLKFKNWAKSLTVALLAVFGFTAAMAQDEEPIITIKTQLYEQMGAANSTNIVIGGFAESDWIDVDCGAGKEEHELMRTVYDEENNTYTGTIITCNVTAADEIRIYGNPENIQYINIDGCYVRDIEFSKLTGENYAYFVSDNVDISGTTPPDEPKDITVHVNAAKAPYLYVWSGSSNILSSVD